MKTWIALLTLLTLSSMSCTSGDAPEPPPAKSTSEAAALSNLDNSLVTCRDDGDCPRGAHCALAACAYECASDTDCVLGRSCDAKGRCR